MSIKLAVTRADGDGSILSEHSFRKERISIGRGADNDILLTDKSKRVSGHHAYIERKGEAYLLTDVSTNGTVLNDLVVEPKKPVLVKNGDRLKMGPFYIKVLIEDEDFRTTLRRLDPARQVERVGDELETVFARHLVDPPEARKEALKQALKAGLPEGVPDQARSLLNALKERFAVRNGGQAAAARPEPAARGPVLDDAALAAIRDLSRRFVGDEKFESPDQIEKFRCLVEFIMTVTFEWLSKCLKGRREFEDQFSADLTLVFAKGGNPIKSAGSPLEIGRYLLDWKSKRDPAGTRNALESAFKDLTMHQLGLLAGVQECLKTVLQRLDPKALENLAVAEAEGLGKLTARLNLSKRAWNKYVEIYKEMFEENSKMFNELIYPNIRKGYLASHAVQEQAAPGTPLEF